MIGATTGGAGANNLTADRAVGMSRCFESSLESFLGCFGIIGENIADTGDGLEASESEIYKMTVTGSGEGNRWAGSGKNGKD